MPKGQAEATAQDALVAEITEQLQGATRDITAKHDWVAPRVAYTATLVAAANVLAGLSMTLYPCTCEQLVHRRTELLHTAMGLGEKDAGGDQC